MKKLLLTTLVFASVFTNVSTVFSQSTVTQKSEIKVRIEQNIDGKVTIQEKVIDATGMNETERQAVIDSVQDSMAGGANVGSKRMKISIEENDSEDRFSHRDGLDSDVRVYTFKDNAPKLRNNNQLSSGDSDWQRNFDNGVKRLDHNIEIWGNNLEQRLESIGKSKDWQSQTFLNKSTSVRSLDVFPNRPDSHIINLRFYVPTEGDVVIKIMDVNGKAVATETVKNFKGDYVGQIELKKNTTGTFFVIVSQNKDGITKRIVID